jgi:hypothetical protein
MRPLFTQPRGSFPQQRRNFEANRELSLALQITEASILQ